MTDAILASIYHDPKNPAAFSSPARLLKAAKTMIPGLTLGRVKKYLQTQDAYTLNRNIGRKRFKRRKIIVKGLKDQYQADLMDFAQLAPQNDGHRFVLTMIDCFSRKATAVSVQSKMALQVREALAKAFEQMGGTPTHLQTDRGSEFFNREVSALLEKLHVHHFATRGKAQIVERFNRTLRGKVTKYMTSRGTGRYIDALQSLIEGYNATPHTSLKKLTPQQVTAENESKVHELLYGDYQKEKIKAPSFELGDTIRVANYALGGRAFERAAHPQAFSSRLYEIVDVKANESPPTYKIRDMITRAVVNGSFYSYQLQHVQRIVAGEADRENEGEK